MAGLHTLEEHIQCASSGSNAWTLAREFIWGERFPEPVALVTHGGTSGGFGGPSVPAGTSVYYYLHDVLGSVIGLANAAGQLVERYTYDPYAKTRVFTATGTTPIQRSNYGNPFNWTAQRLDPATGLYHFLYRTYNPTLGRWLQRDPAGYVDGPNAYMALLASPLGCVDPLGLSIWSGAKALLEGIGDGISDLVDGAIKAVKQAGKDGPWITVAKTALAATCQYTEFRNAGDDPTDAVVETVFVFLARSVGGNGILDFLEREDEFGNPLTLDQALYRLGKSVPELGLAAWSVHGGLVLLTTRSGAVVVVGIADELGDAAMLQRYLAGSGGRWGGIETRLLNHEIATMYENKGWTILNGAGRASEEWIRGPFNGLKGGTWIDITATDGTTVVRIQTIDTLADGLTPIAREAAAARRIESAFPTDTLILIPKPPK